MARPRNDEKRQAILDTAARLICSEGLAVPTSRIAREAGVSNGTLFLYFSTKAELFNQLYLELKSETVSTFLGTPVTTDRRQRLYELWNRTLAWAVAFPEKRRALTRLMASEDITQETREKGLELMQGFEDLVRSCFVGGRLTAAPVKLVAMLVNAIVDATLEYGQNDPQQAEHHRQTSFEALWGIIA